MRRPSWIGELSANEQRARHASPLRIADWQLTTTLPILLVLLVVLIASGVMYWLLVRRYTVGQKKMELESWAERQGYKVFWGKSAQRPQVLGFLPVYDTRVCLDDGHTQLLEITTAQSPGDGGVLRPANWRLAIRRLESDWPVTMLRPVARPVTILDYLPISSLYTTWPGERFLLHGQQRLATRILGKSHLRALLPPDVALLLAERCLVLDFSSRPFDGLELARMDELAEQLLAHLPQRM